MPNVLIIDDDDSVSRLLKTHLTDEGYKVSVVDHAEDGLALALKDPPDLIMLDVFLPDATGFQICSQFRKSPATKTTPIIMMTGAARFPSQQAFGKQRGANEYIFKPFKVIEVGELVHKYIGAKRNHVPPTKIIAETEASVPERMPELEIPVQMVSPEPAKKTNGHHNTTDNMQALSQFLKQAIKKQVTAEPEMGPPPAEDQFMHMLQVTEPVEPLSPVVKPPEPAAEHLIPMMPLMPEPKRKKEKEQALAPSSTLDTLMEISSLASRLSWLTMARKLNLLDAQGHTELKTASVSLISLLTDFLNSEKSR